SAAPAFQTLKLAASRFDQFFSYATRMSKDGWPRIVVVPSEPSHELGMMNSSVAMGSTNQSCWLKPSMESKARCSSSKPPLTFHCGEITYDTDGMTNWANEPGVGSRKRCWRKVVSPNDHTVSPDELPENGTREKLPSKLKVLLNPKFRS